MHICKYIMHIPKLFTHKYIMHIHIFINIQLRLVIVLAHIGQLILQQNERWFALTRLAKTSTYTPNLVNQSDNAITKQPAKTQPQNFGNKDFDYQHLALANITSDRLQVILFKKQMVNFILYYQSLFTAKPFPKTSYRDSCCARNQHK